MVACGEGGQQSTYSKVVTGIIGVLWTYSTCLHLVYPNNLPCGAIPADCWAVCVSCVNKFS